MTLNLLSKKIFVVLKDGKLVKVGETEWKVNPNLKEDVEALERATIDRRRMRESEETSVEEER